MNALQQSAGSAVLHTSKSIVIFAPFGQDASLLAEALEAVDIPTQTVLQMSEFCGLLCSYSAGVLTSEALTPDSISLLGKAVDQQPVWSDVPIILLSNRIDTASYDLLGRAPANVTIIGRPLDASSLITVVATAIRARKKQYQVRDLLDAGESQNLQILKLNERLKRAMMETHHRVKNSLQLISAFVDIQILEYEQAVPTHELMRINGHIRALAAVHDVLTHEIKEDDTTDSVSVQLFLEQLFLVIQDISDGKTLRHNIDNIRLTSRQATSLVLIVNELVLNALKHSAKAVDINLKIDGSVARLTVCDDGPGLPENFDVLQQSNTGLDLVESLVRWDLQGDTSYNSRTDCTGAIIEIRFTTDLMPEVGP